MSVRSADSLDRGRFYRRVALPSVCLCLVAGLHLGRVAICGQTPWKGGGFGMFSTVDAETSRFLRVWLETDGGEWPVEVPAELEKRVAELRAAPSKKGAVELAARLAERAWVSPQQREMQLAEVVQQANERPIAGADLRTASQTKTGQQFSGSETNRAVEAARGQSSATGISFRRVRVEIWRYRFDQAKQTLVSEPLLVTSSGGRQP